MSSRLHDIYVVISTSSIGFLLWAWRRFYRFYIAPLVLICDCGLTCRSCTLRRLLMAKL